MIARLAVVLCFVALVGIMVGCEAPQPKAAPCAKPEAKAAEKPAVTVAPLEDEKGKPFAVVLRVTEPPVIDGKIRKSEWGEPTLNSFYDEITGKPVPKDVQTYVWLRYDSENLYLAAKMLEPEMRDLVEIVTERDGDVWNDDCFEIFLDPGKKRDPADYFHILVNPLGTVSDQRGAPDVTGDVAWTCEGLVVKAGKGGNYWCVEMAIPLKSLGVKGDPAGQHWGANFCRERKPGAAENSTWVNLGPEWHQPEEFGHIAFQP